MKIKTRIHLLLVVSAFICFIEYSQSNDHEWFNESKDTKSFMTSQGAHEFKLLPEPAGIGGRGGGFGRSLSIEGDRALVGAPEMLGTGVVFVYEFDGFEWVQVAMLQPSDEIQNNSFGRAVSLSGDRALIGALKNDAGDDTGSAYVFDFDGEHWVQTVKWTGYLTGPNDDHFGSSVSLDGDRALIGSFRDRYSGYAGAAYVFDLLEGQWELSHVLKDTEGENGDRFGYSVSLSGDKALVGAPMKEAGVAYVYEFDGEIWTETQKITDPNSPSGARFGYAVSLDEDRAAIGSIWGAQSHGATYLYDFDGENWVQTQKIVASDDAYYDLFGSSVALEEDRVVVSAKYGEDRDPAGAVYVFEFDGVSWNKKSAIHPDSEALVEEFGVAVSLSGGHIFAGILSNSERIISAYIFQSDGINWVQKQEINGGDGAANSYFGDSVSIFEDRALVKSLKYSANDNNYRTGVVSVFEFDGLSWNLMATLMEESGYINDYFGKELIINGNRAFIGSHLTSLEGVDSGVVYVFEYNGSNWEQAQVITAINREDGDWFGHSLSLSDDLLLVGAPKVDENGAYSKGAVYAFGFDGANWIQHQKITASDGVQGDQFGFSVSSFGNQAVIGANERDDLASNAGAAYVFEYDGANWLEKQKLLVSDGERSDRIGHQVDIHGNSMLLVGESGLRDRLVAYDFNGTTWVESSEFQNQLSGRKYSVAMSDGKAILGAKYDDTIGSNAGAVFVYHLNKTGWQNPQKFYRGKAGDFFGGSVGIYQNTIMVGAPADDDHGSQSGSVYIIDLDMIYENGFQ